MVQSPDRAAFEPIAPRRAFEEAVAQIAERIQFGDFTPGDALPPERTLAAQMTISRRTLREAIAILVQAKVLEVRPGVRGGTFVRSDVVPIELIAERTDLRLSEVSHVLEARRLVEPQVAQLAAVYAEPEHFASMERTIALQRLHAGDADRQLTADTRFHVLVAQATGNRVIVGVMKEILRKIEIARDSALRGARDPHLAVELHERTLAALRSRDLDRVDAVMDEHLNFLEDHWVAEGGRLRLRQLPPALLPRTRAMAGENLRAPASPHDGGLLITHHDQATEDGA